MARWTNFFAILRGALWLIPALMGAVALVLALSLLHLEFLSLEPNSTGMGWIYTGDSETALDLLSTLLGGLITMTSLGISVTFVTLILAANQLGPRLILNFIGDRAIQAVIGLFLASILYLITVLRSLDGNGEVPHVAVTVGSILAVFCLVALLFYVHKIARAIISDTVVQRVGADLRASISRELLRDRGEAENRGDESGQLEPPLLETLTLETVGYVQVIEYQELVRLSSVAKAVLNINIRAGHFILPGNPHIDFFGLVPLEDKTRQALRAAVVIGPERSHAQDIEFTIRQLVEVALRALSPGINDSFTAVAVLDQLGAGLALAMSRGLPPIRIPDEHGNTRLITNRTEMAGLVQDSFDQIRQAASERPDILIYMADTIRRICPSATTRPARDALYLQVSQLAETARRSGMIDADRDAVLARISQAQIALAP